MKTLIMLSGVPGCGKSTWAKAYAKEHEKVRIISSDGIRIELTGSYDDRSKQNEVWELFDKRIEEYCQEDDVTVILDALNDLNVIRTKYFKNHPNYDSYKLVLFKTPIEVARARNAKRSWDKVPEEIFEQLVKKFEDPSQEVIDLCDEVIYR